MEFLLFYFFSGILSHFAQSRVRGNSGWCGYDESGENYSGSGKKRGMKSFLILPVQVPSCSLHRRVVPVLGNSTIRFQQLLLIGFKIHSHGAAAAAIFWPQQMGCIGFNVNVHTAAAAATMPQVNGFGTHFVWLWQWHHEGSPYSGTLTSLNFSNFWTF